MQERQKLVVFGDVALELFNRPEVLAAE